MPVTPTEPVTLATCADEPIHIPGSVQQSGFLLVLDADGRIAIASENVETFLGLPINLVLGAAPVAIFERELLASLELLETRDRFHGELGYLGAFKVGGALFSVVTHVVDGRRVLEFEKLESLVGSETMNAIITNFVSSLARVHSEQELFRGIVEQLAGLTGFDRTVIYSFDAAGAGTVLAEVNNGRLPSFLGLRFPGSDIPSQARALYVLNTVRIIPDAGYTPSPLRGLAGQQAGTLDLSRSTLRSVSPIHVQYMQNMGTLASMSISIVLEGRLWGLISSHNATPHSVPYLVRSAGDMLTKIVSTQIASLATQRKLAETISFQAAQRSILQDLARSPDYIQGLFSQLPALLKVARADGVALLANGHVHSFGYAPEQDAIRRLDAWLDKRLDAEAGTHSGDEIFHSDHLGAELPWTTEIAAVASGLLSTRISSVRTRRLLWFRREVVETVNWAGKPPSEDEAKSLTPRHSFEIWKETARGSAQPWSEQELESARNFSAAITILGLRSAEEDIELGEARFEQLTAALPAKVFAADDTGCLTYTNERWYQQGLRSSGIWFEDPAFTPEERERAAAAWTNAVAANNTFETELCLRAGDGPERWNLVRAQPFHREGAARAGWIGTFIDLTESKEREMALRVNEKLALSGRMTSVIAHEINNPLEAITNLMYLLRSELPSSGPSAGYIGMVESELNRISGITKQTLRWNRETSDRLEVFTAGALAEDVLRLFAGKIRNRTVRVEIEGDRDLQMRGILGQLRQVLANLVSNAVDAAPLGGSVCVRILCVPCPAKAGEVHAAHDHAGLPSQDSAASGVHAAGNCLGYAVTDDGQGMDESTRRRLFEPFFSTKGDLGNGLGLYISREIVERHGGTMTVDSTPGHGTTMTFLVPQ
jgi:light-regulated signal transduction histidine kinase (bacteriophytochrome)